jgi:hypothetical protein
MNHRAPRAQGHSLELCRRPLVRGPGPNIPEQAPGRGLCLARTDTVEERDDQPRTGRVQGGCQ